MANLNFIRIVLSDEFLYIKEWKVLFCIEHKHVYTKSNILHHCIRNHKSSISSQDRIQLQKFLEKSGSPDSFKLPKFFEEGNSLPPQPYFQTKTEYRCRICGFITYGWKQAKTHLNQSHGLKRDRQNPHVPTEHFDLYPVQTACAQDRSPIWWRVNQSSGIVVVTKTVGTEPEPASITLTVADRLLQAEYSERQRTIVDSNRGSEGSPWGNRTGFPKHLDGLDRLEIAAVIKIPSLKNSPTEEDRVLARICSLTRICLEGTRRCTAYGENIKWKYRLFDDQMSKLLVSAQLGKPGNQPLRFIQEDTAKDYQTYWAQFLCYVYRTWKDHRFTGRTEPLFVMYEWQTEELKRLAAAVSESDHNSTLNDPEKFLKDPNQVIGFLREDLADLFFKTSAEFIEIIYKKSFLELALVSFYALKNIRPGGALMTAPEASSSLSRVIYCAQLVVIGFLWSKYSDKEVKRELQRWSDKFLTNHNPTPVAALQNLRSYAIEVGRNEPALPTTYWDGETTVVYKEIRLDTKRLASWVRHLIERAIQVWNRLVFDITVPDLNLKDPKVVNENKGNTNAAYTVFADARGGIPELQKRFRQSFAAKFFKQGSDEETNWRDLFSTAWVESYEQTVEEFLGLILLLVHICAGQPARGSEILGTRWKNDQILRNMFVYRGSILISICYHKSQNLTEKQRYVHRLLPPQLGQMVANFLTFVQDIRYLARWYSLRSQRPEATEEEITRQACQATFMTFLWAGSDDRWNSQKLSNLLRRESIKFELPELSIQSWRQIAVAIAQHFFQAHHEVLDFEDDGSRVDGEGFEQSDTFDQLASHSTHAGSNHYAVRTDIGYAKNEKILAQHVKACKAWQNWLQLPSDDSSSQPEPEKGFVAGIKHARSESSALVTSEAKRTLKSVATQLNWSMSEVERQGQRLFKTKEFSYRCPEQRTALEHIVTGTSYLLIVLPTGGGKSLLFQLPSLLNGARHTVVVIPFRALLDDMMQKCKDAGVPSSHWCLETANELMNPLIFVGLEQVSGPEFHAFLNKLYTTDNLDRIVMDEAHLCLTDDVDFRPSLLDLNLLRRHPVQMVCLTATLPVIEEKRFCQLMDFQRKHLAVVRASTSRFNLKIQVAAGGTRAECEQLALDKLESWTTRWDNKRSRAVLFINDTKQVEAFAEKSGHQYVSYHAKAADREVSFHKWRAGNHPDYRVMIATSALYQGVDLSEINLVIMLEPPNSIYHLVQAMGRAGRADQQAQILILIPKNWRPRFAGKADAWNSQAQLEGFLLAKECRHNILSAIMDDRNECCNPGDQELISCDNCVRISPKTPDWFDPSLPPLQKGTLPVTKMVHPYPVTPAVVKTADDVSRGKLERSKRSLTKNLANREIRFEKLERGLVKFKTNCAACYASTVLLSNEIGNHPFSSCPHLYTVIDARKQAMEDTRKNWLASGICFVCLLPDRICGRVDNTSCTRKYKDIVLPFCWAVFRDDTLREQFALETTCMDLRRFMIWLGERPAGNDTGMKTCNAANLVQHAIESCTA
ncbi:hypothetical protein H072_8519 [Dactylellina haptotyla CBS 200.50]|uniref:DNA 3'-5' helicase n=1 Tax=Dactylellina haptotyla (strain CBS 200.50) TaxID=1284197 RepID=S8A4R0_DACHA|nr:hypothetical protein H072_8519 [Dactylellina haptotyla CBS 200.50]